MQMTTKYNLYITRDSIKKAAQELKSGTEKVMQWYKVNRLKTNPTK